MKKKHFILLTLFVGMHAHLFAQMIKTQSVAINFSTVLDLEFASGQNIPSSTFNFNSTNALDNGIAVGSATTLTFNSNQAWYVTIAAGSAFFTSGTNPNVLPASLVRYRLHGNTTYTSLTTTAASLSGTSGSKNTRGTGSIIIDYFLNPGYIYPPATDYNLTIQYTISNQ